MNQLRPYPIDGEQSAFPANVSNIVNSHTLTAGAGLKLSKTSVGVHISLDLPPHKDNTTNRGSFDFNQEYWPNDIVYFDKNVSYSDQNGIVITNMQYGSFVCVQHIPAGVNNSAFFLSSVVPAFVAGGASADDIMANNFRWYNYNIYYPTTAITSSQAIVADSSGYNIVASQSFWTPIGGGGSSTQQSSSLNWNWRGLYTSNPPSQYMANDAVLVQAGTSAGGYVSAVNGNNTNPASGLGWFQVFTNNVYY